MLSSEDAFSYAIARTEKSGSNGQQQADAKKKRATYVFLVRFRSRSGSKKKSTHVRMKATRLLLARKSANRKIWIILVS